MLRSRAQGSSHALAVSERGGLSQAAWLDGLGYLPARVASSFWVVLPRVFVGFSRAVNTLVMSLVRQPCVNDAQSLAKNDSVSMLAAKTEVAEC
jgi:hypothetical protein